MGNIDREEWRQMELRQLAEMYNTVEDMVRDCPDQRLRSAAESRLNRIAVLATKLGGLQFATERYTARAIARVQGLSIVNRHGDANE
jgi:hypothetical protein